MRQREQPPLSDTTLQLPCAVDDVSDGYHTF